MCTQNGFYPNIVREHPRAETRLMMVEAGIGVAVVTSLIETCSSHNLKFISIKDNDTSLNLIAAWKKTNTNPAISHFLHQIENYHIKHA